MCPQGALAALSLIEADQRVQRLHTPVSFNGYNAHELPRLLSLCTVGDGPYSMAARVGTTPIDPGALWNSSRMHMQLLCAAAVMLMSAANLPSNRDPRKGGEARKGYADHAITAAHVCCKPPEQQDPRKGGEAREESAGHASTAACCTRAHRHGLTSLTTCLNKLHVNCKRSGVWIHCFLAVLLLYPCFLVVQ